MMASLDLSLPRGIFILLLQVSMWSSVSFLVIGSSEPIVAMLGADTTLPCCVSPDMSVENMELWWFRSQFSDAVYMYQDGMEQMRKQLVDFKGRAGERLHHRGKSSCENLQCLGLKQWNVHVSF
ncbi:butyrophilin subfamily 2 member A1-like [Pteropus medius]|uniref:butyrophilin subfamily 2 member A1-like n=1 Tax=Pteropus vampyrus TaxID=132908 RepID=UPI00196B21F2|nr:butyrophilin subfamily 2 member A1-like [Pteropus giganteus]